MRARCFLGPRDQDDLADSDLETVLRKAARAAAVTVSRPGADPPYRHEVR